MQWLAYKAPGSACHRRPCLRHITLSLTDQPPLSGPPLLCPQMVTASGDGLLKIWNIAVRYHMDEDPKVGGWMCGA